MRVINFVVRTDLLQENDKLAATTMNPHYQAYSELASPHSPGEGGGGGYSNGHHVMGYQHHPLHHHHHHHHHHINNNNNNNSQTNNNNNNTGSTGSPAQTNASSNPQQQVKVCAGCGGKIVERFLLHALDRFWHNSCLKCTCCGAMLADIGTSCFTRSNMILCKADYIRYARSFSHSRLVNSDRIFTPRRVPSKHTRSEEKRERIRPDTRHHRYAI